MCGIFASHSPSKLIELGQLNKDRGTRSWSITRFEIIGDSQFIVGTVASNKSDFPTEESQCEDMFWGNKEKSFYVGHVMEPTQNESLDKTHPAKADRKFLWHNGILLSEKREKTKWDTSFMVNTLTGIHKPWEISATVGSWYGSFACILSFNNYVCFFRNELSPMFLNDDGDFSSTEFKDSYPMLDHYVFLYRPIVRKLQIINKFRKKERVYFGL